MLSSLARTFSESLTHTKAPPRVPSFNGFNAGVDEVETASVGAGESCDVMRRHSIDSAASMRRDSLDSQASSSTEADMAIDVPSGAGLLFRSMSLPTRPLTIPRPMRRFTSGCDADSAALATGASEAVPCSAPLAPVAPPASAPAPGSGAAAMAANVSRRERYTIQGVDAYEYVDMIRSL